MLKLYRFELFRQRFSIFIGSILIIILNLWLFLERFVLHTPREDFLSKNGILGFILFTGLFIYLLISLIKILTRDVLKEEGPFVFLAPYSGYEILGAKLLTIISEGLIYLCLFGLSGFQYFSELFKGLTPLRDPKTMAQIHLGIKLTGAFVLNVFVSLLLFSLTIYLAICLYKSFFSHKKQAGLISFGLFLAINFVLKYVLSFLVLRISLHQVNFTMFSHYHTFEEALPILLRTLNIQSIISFVFFILFFLLVGYLLDKKVEL